ncbi:hypothetical protein B4N89_33435 [Embleya scabrispora]|uniref:DUF4232 domain-containing protein n=1 Tax=Embleya scabrispora TaxID=159449 RepID=A0A1T3NQM5_9ACTN|nr:DUF4232 domain-containing protein [Embleya scabrispora]OPC79010.1 hypothetical protein B4N89_33435 [Embleya scabrispora]
MFGNRSRALLLSAAVVGGAMTMTACQGTDSGNAAQGNPPAAAPAGQTVTQPSALGASTTGGNTSTGSGSTVKDSASGKTVTPNKATGTTSGGAGNSGSGPAKCRTDDLSFLADDATIDGDDDRTVAVTLDNLAGDCTMTGFAGVDLKTTAGTISAERTDEPVVPVILKRDTSISFGIHYPANDSGGSGIRITGLLVTPPGETKSADIPWPGATTLPVTDGTGTPVTVGPMGSAGQGG